ncbi:hypothetical protein PGT21_037278 [Puccinia graminis f. sp. tritici]|uniref:Uncharacterized protein n=2 Tax=Puccinia graminis f. sp. tritici TaxID=56615 RepID=E3KIY7_PUCGT|nr:uncharacterized protein PGTG_10640 [Puccinia graminis f. sp. tritici CRL 75-36-700-3]XP_003338032.1 uncharacterized protein PGTG_19612 [Puccinia graminis f. sp. tritici CRL 75-36-700-3]EFP84262.1 hypothetical protein PGTG_10640 [Puccinia graminis f. sp. tritici CRL 75-36-700-3]EFP93613.1 hypothetical protein PGTG_19612 [Puccinia graminis f. sp. tritici CRL 75-36-700-3]KAA1120219.1 hypothetical protein PGT21_037278 [Puccinia graminis f. sp. tritici]
MANEDSGPSRSHTHRGRSRSPGNERRSRPRDRRSPSGGERDGVRWSRSRDRRPSERHADRDRRRSSRDRDTVYSDKRDQRDRYTGRHGSPSRSPPRRRHRSTSSSSSSSSSSSASSGKERSREKKHSKKSKSKRDSSISSEDQHESRKHSSKSKSKRSHKSRHRSPGEDSSDEHARKKQARAEKKERKRKKREKKEKEKKKEKKGQSSKHKSAISEYGKYGIITEADMFTKDQEFRAWLVEEKTLNPETVSQIKMKELFKVYMEDFNTATLPHEKFYALEKYEARMNAIRSGNVTTQSDTYDPRADEAALAAQHKRVAKTDGEVYIGRAQLEQLRRIERERVEASRMKRMGMEVKESMGVRYEAD